MNLKKAKRLRRMAAMLTAVKGEDTTYTRHASRGRGMLPVSKLRSDGSSKMLPIRVQPKCRRGVYRALKIAARGVDNRRGV